MSVHYDRTRDRWVVRWREGGRQRARTIRVRGRGAGARCARCRRLASDEPARSDRVADRRASRGVYAYETGDGTRWRFVFRQSDGRLTSRRGSRPAARRWLPARSPSRRCGAARCARRGDTFGEFWAKVLEAKRPYVTAGHAAGLHDAGRKRLLPWFGSLKLAAVDEDRIRDVARRDGRARRRRRSERQDGQQRAHVSVDDARRSRPPAAHLAESVPLGARAARRADRDRLPARWTRSRAISTPAPTTTGRWPSS